MASKPNNVLHIHTREPVEDDGQLDIVQEYEQNKRPGFPWFWFLFGCFVLTCL